MQEINITDVNIFADGLDHPECVAMHPDGSVWAGGEAGQIYRISPDGKEIIEVANTGGFILGIAFSPGAEWLAVCDLKHHCVWKLELSSYQLSVFADGADGIKFNIPNYPVFDSGGMLYVSESGAFREVSGKIFRFDSTGNGVVWHAGPFNFSNGMCLNENENFLYVVCTWLPGVERVEINADGSAGKREVYCTLPRTCPDGVAFDTLGNLYISCYTPNHIYSVNKKQEIHLLVEDWEAHTLCNPTNIAFSIIGNSFLYATSLGRWNISRMPMNVEGLALAVNKNNQTS